MTTITLNHPWIEQNYNNYELKILFTTFLETITKESDIKMYEISVEDLPQDVLESYKNIDNINFIKREKCL